MHPQSWQQFVFASGTLFFVRTLLHSSAVSLADKAKLDNRSGEQKQKHDAWNAVCVTTISFVGRNCCLGWFGIQTRRRPS